MVQLRAGGTRADVEAAFQAVPETQVGEILDGELFVSPRPMPRHSSATVALSSQLAPPFRYGRGGPGGPGPGSGSGGGLDGGGFGGAGYNHETRRIGRQPKLGQRLNEK